MKPYAPLKPVRLAEEFAGRKVANSLKGLQGEAYEADPGAQIRKRIGLPTHRIDRSPHPS